MRRLATDAALLIGLCLAPCLSLGPSNAQASILPTPGSTGEAACALAGEVPGVGGVLHEGCEVLLTPVKVAEWLTSKGWSALNAALGNVPKDLTGAVQKVVNDGANAVLNGVSGWIASGAVWLVSSVATLIQSTTSPQVTSSWFGGTYAVMTRIAVALGLPLLLFAVGRAIFRRDLGELGRSLLLYLPLSALLTAGAVIVTQMALAITDSLSNSVAGAVGADAHTFFQGAAKGLIVLGAGNTALPGFVVAVAAIFAAIAAFLLWIELILRSAAIYVVLLFMPLAFIAMVWPTTVRFARRMVEVLAAVILSKFVIVAIIVLAASGLVHAGLGSNIDAALAGIALMGLAVFAPWTLLRMLPLMEAAVAHNGDASRMMRPSSYSRWQTYHTLKSSDHVRRSFGEVSSAGSQTSAAQLLGTQGSGAGGGARVGTTAAAGTAAGIALAGGASAAHSVKTRAEEGGGAAVASVKGDAGDDGQGSSGPSRSGSAPGAAAGHGTVPTTALTPGPVVGMTGRDHGPAESRQASGSVGAADHAQPAAERITRGNEGQDAAPGAAAPASVTPQPLGVESAQAASPPPATSPAMPSANFPVEHAPGAQSPPAASPPIEPAAPGPQEKPSTPPDKLIPTEEIERDER